VLAPFHAGALERLRKNFAVTYENWMETKKLLSPAEFVKRIQEQNIEVLIIEADFVKREVFEKISKLQFLGICRADTNHVDIEAATEAGVIVVNTPARNDVAVAELAIGLMLSVLRGIPSAHNMVSSRSWTDPTAAYFSLRGFEITGKTIGIVGLGAIGKQVAKRLKAFDCTILAYDPFVDEETMRSFGARSAQLDELMNQSDIITIHLPVNPDTLGIINADRVAMMKHSAYLINTASTFVVDNEAIIKALQEKRIAGAGFDVYETWPVQPDSPLLDLDNVVLTPHIGGATYETIERYSNMVVDDAESFLKGERPKHIKNPQVLEKHG